MSNLKAITIDISVDLIIDDLQFDKLNNPLELDLFAKRAFGSWGYNSVSVSLTNPTGNDIVKEDIKERLSRTSDEDLLDDVMKIRSSW